MEMTSKIENAIDTIEDYIANCKFQTLSTTKIIVNKEEIDELIRELRQVTPSEIEDYRQIIMQKENILNDARAKAKALIDKTTAQTTELINEHEIMQQAYAKANEVVSHATQEAQDILDNATVEANSYKASAVEYIDGLLEQIESLLTRATSLANQNYEELIANLNSCTGIVRNNRMELRPAEDEGFESIDVSGATSGPGIM